MRGDNMLEKDLIVMDVIYRNTIIAYKNEFKNTDLYEKGKELFGEYWSLMEEIKEDYPNEDNKIVDLFKSIDEYIKISIVIAYELGKKEKGENKKTS